ncbi:MAG: hypothetical protein ACR2NZ_00015 [Rubripirellula sp.]
MMRLNQDLTSAKWIYAKGLLFLLLALIAASLLLYRAPRLDVLALLLICVWASCRAYYFAFYVIEHYVDTNYRFSGLVNFASYVLRGKVRASDVRSNAQPKPEENE